MIKLVASKKDLAGLNIAKACENIGLNVHYIEEDIIFAEKLPDAEAYIFLSRHKSESEKPCLTCHFPGNFGKDIIHGGNPKELGISFPSLEKKFIRNLAKIKGEWNEPELEKFQIVLEATHHGPTHFKKPILFVEIGSSEKEWTNELAGKLVAEAVKRTLGQKDIYLKHAIAFGGTHYPDKFTDILIKDVYSLGHILPKYQTENLNDEMFKQMLEKSAEEIKYCLIDWKGINRRAEISEMADKYGLTIVKL